MKRRYSIDPRFKDKGRWELERERFQIEDTVPPTLEKEAEDVSACVDRLIEKLGLNFSITSEKVSSNWLSLFSTNITKYANPGEFLNDGRFVIYAKNTNWKNELSRYFSDTILKKIQTIAPEVKGLFFKLESERKY